MKPFTVLYYNDENSYSRNRAIGMSYLNRLIIEEATEFECYGVLNGIVSAAGQASYSNYILEQISNLESRTTVVHLIFSADFSLELKSWNINGLIEYIISLFKSSTQIMISRIGSERLECIQKEQYRKFYSEGGQIKTTIQTQSRIPRFGNLKWNKFYNRVSNEDTDSEIDIESCYVCEYKTEVYKSVGDDIEDFYNLLKEQEINCINPNNGPQILFLGLLQKVMLLDPSNSSEPIVRSFHLSMLTDQEEDENLKGKFHKFKNKTALLEKKENYSLSLCARKTFCIAFYNSFRFQSQLMYRVILFDIDELDPWQEKIMKNFQELKKSRRKRTLEEPLFNYWETDSDSDQG